MSRLSVFFLATLFLTGMSMPAAAEGGLLELLFGRRTEQVAPVFLPPPHTSLAIPPRGAMNAPRRWSSNVQQSDRIPRDSDRIKVVSRGSETAARRWTESSVVGNAYCVRGCDGFYFPVPGATGTSARPIDLCRKACPGAEMSLFFRNGADMADAKSEWGERYGDVARAFQYRTVRVSACTCEARGAPVTWVERVLSDTTLQRGDIVVTPEGARVFQGKVAADGVRRTDFADIRVRGAVSASLLREADRVLGFSFQAERARGGAGKVLTASGDANQITVTASPATLRASAPQANAAALTQGPRIVLPRPTPE